MIAASRTTVTRSYYVAPIAATSLSRLLSLPLYSRCRERRDISGGASWTAPLWP